MEGRSHVFPQHRTRRRGDPAHRCLWCEHRWGGVTRRDRTPPTTPTNLRITATTDTTVSLAWNASTDNSGNFSYRVTESSPFNTYTVAVPQTRTTITFTRLWPQQTQVRRLRRRRRGQPLRQQQHGHPHGPGRRHTADAGAAVDRDADQSGAGQLLLDGVGRQRKPGLLHDLRQRDRAGFLLQRDALLGLRSDALGDLRVPGRRE